MANYYVDSDVAGPGSGTIGDPWDDIGSNINSLSAGDTMYLRGGSVSYQLYEESEISITVDGSSGNEITIEPYQSELVEMQNNTASEHILNIAGDYITINGKDQLYVNKNDNNGYAIYINSAHVTIQDAEIANRSGSYRALVYFASGSSYGLIDGCEIHDSFHSTTTDSHGVILSGSDHTTVQNCTIYDCYGDCVYIHDSNPIEGWSVLDNTLYTTLGACSENGIDAKRNDSGTRATISGNTIYGFYVCPGTCGGSGDGDGEGISIHNTCSYVDCYDNTIYDCSSGIVVEDNVQSVVVRNNLIYDLHTLVEDTNATVNGVGAFHVHAINVDIWNNTVHNSPVNSFLFQSSLSDVVIENNIFNDCGNIYNEGMSGKTADYNCWYNCGETLSGANDVTSDPLFEDEANDDYTLASNSPCIDAGTDVGLPYNGSAPDMGAFETSGATTSTSTSTTLSTSTSTTTVSSTSTSTTTASSTSSSTSTTTAAAAIARLVVVGGRMVTAGGRMVVGGW